MPARSAHRRAYGLIGLVVVLGLLGSTAVALGAAPALTKETIPKYGVALEVPAGWVVAGVPASKDTTHLAAIFRSPTAHNGFRANLNLLISTLSPGETLDNWVFGSQKAKYRSLGTISNVTIGGVPAIGYETTKLVKAAGAPLFTLEYAFARQSRVYLFTYTSLAIDKSLYESTFKASAPTIRFVVTPPTA